MLKELLQRWEQVDSSWNGWRGLSWCGSMKLCDTNKTRLATSLPVNNICYDILSQSLNSYQSSARWRKLKGRPCHEHNQNKALVAHGWKAWLLKPTLYFQTDASCANSVPAQCEVTQIRIWTAVWTNCSLVQHESCCLPRNMRTVLSRFSTLS